jgi:DNA-binding NarL/FixJ family response regulator
MSLKVLIVDDHEVARVGISYLLQDRGHLVSGSVASGGEAAELLKNESFDVVLLDVRMPNEDGLATIELIRQSHKVLPIVMLSAYDNPTYVARAAALGANGYVLKSGSTHELDEALTRAANGDEPPPNSPLMRVRRMMREEVDVHTLPPAFPLTGREAQVLRHIALGLSNKEIARSLTISVETVKEHVQNVLRKISANDRTDAAVRAVKSGIVDR